MSGTDVARARKARGWTQHDLASRLGVSQPYVSLLERNRRAVPRRLALRLSNALGLPPSTLPVGPVGHPLAPRRAAASLGRVGYPGFAYLRGGQALNPAEVLVRTLRAENLDARLVEALPWVLTAYPDLDWDWLVREAKLNDLQNRLGLVVTVARKRAERRADSRTAETLSHWERVLERSRLQREEAFRESLTDAEREWLRANRSPEAARWNVLSTLTDEAVADAT
jgi:transcriptional regulator with XRE-family HTH domain